MRILILSEPSNIAAHLELILPQGGHEVIGPARTLEQALQAVDGSPPSLVLLNFPPESERSGLEIARVLRRKWGTQLIIMSNDHPADGQDVALGYLQIPLDHETVLDSLAAVEDLLDGRLPQWMPRALRVIGLPDPDGS